MRERTRIVGAAAVAVVGVVVAAAVALGGDRPSPGRSGGEPSGGGAVAGVCAPGHADCVDTIVLPDGDEPVSGDVGDEPVEPSEPQVVEPDPRAVGLRARPFDTATVGDDDRTVTIDFVGGVEPCSVLGRVDVTSGPRAVTITLLEGHLDTGEEVACIAIGVLKRVVVDLGEPLGGRTVADGAAGS